MKYTIAPSRTSAMIATIRLVISTLPAPAAGLSTVSIRLLIRKFTPSTPSLSTKRFATASS